MQGFVWACPFAVTGRRDEKLAVFCLDGEALESKHAGFGQILCQGAYSVLQCQRPVRTLAGSTERKRAPADETDGAVASGQSVKLCACLRPFSSQPPAVVLLRLWPSQDRRV